MTPARPDAETVFERGNALVETGDRQAAEAEYRRADELGHSAAATYVGMFSEARGELGTAEAAYRRASERNDGQGAFRLGMLLSRRGDWDDANAAWQRAEELGREPAGPDPDAILRRRPVHADGAAPAVVAGSRSAFSSPVLIGAVTVLAAIIAVFLAYNANEGLPFVPTRELKVDVSDASNLVIGNDVREGGFRIGLVSDMKPIVLRNGQVGAVLTLKLDKANGNVPIDSTATIQSRSVLGLKFLELHRGRSRAAIPDGGTLPLSHTTVPVQVDDVFGTFNARTRQAIESDLRSSGDLLTGRGSDLNDTISSLPALFGHLQPVAAYLSAPGTGLTRFIDTLNGLMGAIAPVANTNVQLLGNAASTFSAITRDPNAYEQTIARGPSTLSVSTDSLRAQQPFLVDLQTLGHNLVSPTRELGLALPDINPAIEAGTQTLKRTPSLNHNLQGVMNALKDLARNPGTNMALNALVDTTGTVNPMIRYLGPYVTVCNSWNYWWTFLSEHISEETSFGFAQRVMVMQANPVQPNNVGSQGAYAPVNGGVADSPLGGNAYLHAPNYGAAVDANGNADCEIGQRGYPKRLNAFDPLQRTLDVDPHTPGDQGPTFMGRASVPAGETFSRSPQFGPRLTSNPSNP